MGRKIKTDEALKTRWACKEMISRFKITFWRCTQQRFLKDKICLKNISKDKEGILSFFKEKETSLIFVKNVTLLNLSTIDINKIQLFKMRYNYPNVCVCWVQRKQVILISCDYSNKDGYCMLNYSNNNFTC